MEGAPTHSGSDKTSHPTFTVCTRGPLQLLRSISVNQTKPAEINWKLKFLFFLFVLFLFHKSRLLGKKTKTKKQVIVNKSIYKKKERKKEKCRLFQLQTRQTCIYYYNYVQLSSRGEFIFKKNVSVQWRTFSPLEPFGKKGCCLCSCCPLC